MAKIGKIDQKASELNRTGTLNPHPEAITDPLFKGNPFFDPTDLLQIRYEMLRRHYAEGMSIVEAAQAFGVSRPTFYQAQAAFEQSGLSGLLPKQRGLKGGHKLSPAVLDYVVKMKSSLTGATTKQCLQIIQNRFGITVHRRTLERALLHSRQHPENRT
ncbi:MAG: helix-turn-helix domain-containing protein [Bryobacteraceae bacterium]